MKNPVDKIKLYMSYNPNKTLTENIDELFIERVLDEEVIKENLKPKLNENPIPIRPRAPKPKPSVQGSVQGQGVGRVERKAVESLENKLSRKFNIDLVYVNEVKGLDPTKLEQKLQKAIKADLKIGSFGDGPNLKIVSKQEAIYHVLNSNKKLSTEEIDNIINQIKIKNDNKYREALERQGGFENKTKEKTKRKTGESVPPPSKGMLDNIKNWWNKTSMKPKTWVGVLAWALVLGIPSSAIWYFFYGGATTPVPPLPPPIPPVPDVACDASPEVCQRIRQNLSEVLRDRAGKIVDANTSKPAVQLSTVWNGYPVGTKLYEDGTYLLPGGETGRWLGQ